MLKFNYKGVEAQFGPKEFIAMTGLSFGPTINIPAGNSNSKQWMIGGKGALYLKDIEAKFVQVCAATKGSGDDALKAGVCLFVYGVLVGCGYCRHASDPRYINLCDEIKHLNSFPWGRLSYEYLISHFYKAKSTLDVQFELRRNISVDIIGFAFAIQVWALEVFPQIGSIPAYVNLSGLQNQARLFGWICG